MSKVISGILILWIFGISCKKNDPPPTVVATKYMSLTPGSSWNYEVVNNAPAGTSVYTLTSTSKDSVINGKSYHVFTNSSGSGNEYYNINGNDYNNFRSLPAALGGSNAENIYLKDNAAVGVSWNQSYPLTVSGIPLTASVTNTITEKGISKTVKGIAYTNVIHVTTTISATLLGAPLPAGALVTDIQSFYAEKFGMIQSINKINLNYPGFPASTTDQQTNLNSADIK